MITCPILFLHWLGDFVLQTRSMADNKSSSMLALSMHVLAYTSMLLGGLLLLMEPTTALVVYVLLNGSLHFITDFWTSKCTKYLWQQKNVHAFFMMVGFDQLIHSLCLIISAEFLL